MKEGFSIAWMHPVTQSRQGRERKEAISPFLPAFHLDDRGPLPTSTQGPGL